MTTNNPTVTVTAAMIEAAIRAVQDAPDSDDMDALVRKAVHAALASRTPASPTSDDVERRAIDLLAKLEAAGGNNAGAFTLRSLGAVGSVFKAKLAVAVAAITAMQPDIGFKTETFQRLADECAAAQPNKGE